MSRLYVQRFLFITLTLTAACGSETAGVGGAPDSTLRRGEPSAVTAAGETFTVSLPGVTIRKSPYDPYGILHWDETHPADAITVPNGRPIYALLVSGYTANTELDELYYYDFAKYVAEQGGYVHFAWWNNLLAPYMERPLHDGNSSPGWDIVPPFSKALEVLLAPTFIPNFAVYGEKALPREDNQFQADAKAFLRAIRRNNPNARIVIVGHSMGGGAVSRLGSDPAIADLDIDILAPIDPVGNRSWPATSLVHEARSDFNWTRWRATRNEFLGYRQKDCVRGGGIFGNMCKNYATSSFSLPVHKCRAIGPWRNDPSISSVLFAWVPSLDPLYCPGPYIHNPAPRTFGTNIKYLYHRYQREFLFPFDFGDNQYFRHWAPRVTSNRVEDGNNFQKPVVTCADGADPLIPAIQCHSQDGHGEIIGARQYDLDTGKKELVFYATKVTGNWPKFSPGESAQNRSLRRDLVRTFVETGDAGGHAPRYPQLDMVSADLIRIARMFGKPVAVAGGPYTGKGCAPILFDASGSYDTDGQIVSYAWDFDNDGVIDATGTTPTVEHAYEASYVGIARLVVTDNDGNTDEATAAVAVLALPATTPPEITSIQATPDVLWAPEHVMVPVNVSVTLAVPCATTCRIVDVQSNEDEDESGSGHTEDDWEITGDLSVNLRAERSGGDTGRVYTITVECTNPIGKTATASVQVVVPHDQGHGEGHDGEGHDS
ncbi:MAG: PKD domain-containing protein [Nitrospirota bacterium]|nr:PKD domain-containing protein [Nitrospirota bacterium]